MGKKQARQGVRERKTSIQINFNYENERHWEPVFHGVPTEAALDRAERIRAEIVKEIELGLFDYARWFPNSPKAKKRSVTVPTFFDVAKRYLAQLQSDSARKDYRNSLNRRWHPLYDMPVNEVAYSDLLDCLEDSETMSPKYYNNEKISVTRVLEFAADLELIDRNPARKLKPRKNANEDPDPFTQDEANRIINYMYANFDVVYGAYCEVGFYSGMRSPSEMIGLRWQNVDLEEKLAVVRERTVSGKHQAGTKTGKPRQVELFDRVVSALKRLESHSKEWVFICPDTNEPFLTGKALNSRWRDTLAALNIRPRRMYNMRHTCVTLLLEQRVADYVAAQHMGHSVQMFQTVYAKWLNRDTYRAELRKADVQQPVPEAPEPVPQKPKLRLV